MTFTGFDLLVQVRAWTEYTPVAPSLTPWVWLTTPTHLLSSRLRRSKTAAWLCSRASDSSFR